jgi:glutaredoxin
MNIEHVPGKNKGNILIYTLSTCGWCKKTKALLKEMGVEYHYIDVDLLEGDEQEEAVAAMGKYNPGTNFPTIIIEGHKAIVGFKEDEIRKALK